MAEPTKNPKLVTPTFRASFVNVFKPRAAEEGGKPKYSLAMIFDEGTDLSALKKAAVDCAVKKYGKTPEGKPNVPAGFKWPFHKGEEKAQYEGYGPGKTYFNATSTQPPGVIDQQKQPITDETEFYSGCYARATINFYCYDKKGRGVGVGLNNLQKVRDGAPLGRTRAEDDFDAIEDASGSAAPELPADDDLMGV